LETGEELRRKFAIVADARLLIQNKGVHQGNAQVCGLGISLSLRR